MLGDVRLSRYRTVSGGLENVFELLARVRKAGTGTPKLFELSVADRKYNKPERDRAKRSGLRIFMLGRMFLPKTLRHDRTHRQEVLMTSVRAVSISRKVFVLPVVREKSEPILFSRFERLLRFGQACGAGTHGIGHRLPGFRRGLGASARPLACLLARSPRAAGARRTAAGGGRGGVDVPARVEHSSVPLGPGVGAPRKFAIVHYGNFDKFP